MAAKWLRGAASGGREPRERPSTGGGRLWTPEPLRVEGEWPASDCESRQGIRANNMVGFVIAQPRSPLSIKQAHQVGTQKQAFSHGGPYNGLFSTFIKG